MIGVATSLARLYGMLIWAGGLGFVLLLIHATHRHSRHRLARHVRLGYLWTYRDMYWTRTDHWIYNGVVLE